MKKYVLLIAFLAGAFMVQAQRLDSRDTAYMNKPFPPFKILKPDSTWFTHFDLPKDRPVILMYFSPECGHCQVEAEELVKNADKLKEAFLLLVSYHTPQEVADFAKQYKLKKFPHLAMGRDTEYNLPAHFQVEQTPFMAVYNRKGVLTRIFRSGTDALTLIKLVGEQ